MTLVTCSDTLYVGDAGVNLIIDLVDCGTAVDLSTLNTAEFIFKKPDDTPLVKTASVVGDPTNGQLGYVFQTGELDQAGRWQVQAYLDITSPAFIGHSQIDEFEVIAPLPRV